MPSAHLSTVYWGEGFSLAISAAKRKRGLVLHNLIVTAIDYLGAPLVSYHFQAPLDEDGVQFLARLFDEWELHDDCQRLQTLRALTNAHSCGEWKVESFSGERGCRADTFEYHVPRFDEFAANPEQILRYRHRIFQREGRTERLEAELAAWGEFLSIRYLECRDNLWETKVAYKIGLPLNPQRTFRSAYRELYELLTNLASLVEAEGPDRLPKALTAYSDLVFASSPEEALIRLGRTTGLNGDEPLSVATNHVLGALYLRNNTASISITRACDSCITGVHLLISQTPPATELSTTQIRAILELHEIVYFGGDMATRKLGAALLHRLLTAEKNSVPTSLMQVSSWSTLRIDTTENLRALTIEGTFTTSPPSYFLSRSRCEKLRPGEHFFREETKVITAEMLNEARSGIRTISFRILPQLYREKPDLIGRLTLTESPDGLIQILVTNGMRGSHSSTLRGEFSRERDVRTYVMDRIFDAFCTQVTQGWSPLVRLIDDASEAVDTALQSLDRTTGSPSMPSPRDRYAVESYAVAGSFLSLLSRSGLPNFWGFGSVIPDSSVSLSFGCGDLGGALESVFINSRLTSVTVRTRQMTSAHSMWSTTATLTHLGLQLDDEITHEIITLFRGFFRDQIRARAARDPHPDQFASGIFFSRLRTFGFVPGPPTA